MKNVRIRFEKSGLIKYISHLDLNLCIKRALFQTKIPIWYTEGFNCHPFVRFVLSLPLGVAGLNEFFDIKLLDEHIDLNLISIKLNQFLPKGIKILSIQSPIMKSSDIKYALIRYEFPTSIFILKVLKYIFQMQSIEIIKKTKSNKKIIIDLKNCIHTTNINCTDNGIVLDLVLPTGNDFNISPFLIIDKIQDYFKININPNITRVEMYNSNMETFS